MPQLMQRVRRLFAAQAHEAIDHLESPTRMSAQVLREIDDAMQRCRAGLVGAEAQVRQLDAERSRLERAAKQACDAAAEQLAWQGRAAAREAAQQALSLRASAAQIVQARDAAQAAEARLRRQLQSLKTERLRAAGSQLRAAALSSLATAGGAPDAWTAAHERRQLLEDCERSSSAVLAQADAAAELLAEDNELGGGPDDGAVDQLLDQLERAGQGGEA